MCFESATRKQAVVQNESVHPTTPGPPFDWDATVQSMLLSMSAVGLIVGTLATTWFVNHFYVRTLLSTSMLVQGVISLATPWLASYSGPNALELSRFAIGFYAGLLAPAANLVCYPWFPARHRNNAITFAMTGHNVGNVLFSASGLLRWQDMFYIPGTVICKCYYQGKLR